VSLVDASQLNISWETTTTNVNLLYKQDAGILTTIFGKQYLIYNIILFSVIKRTHSGREEMLIWKGRDAKESGLLPLENLRYLDLATAPPFPSSKQRPLTFVCLC
jgi:hypothetical protein